MNVERNLEEAFDSEKLNNELKETLEKASLTLKLYLKDDNTIGIEQVKDSKKSTTKEKSKEVEKFENLTDVALDRLKVDTKKSMVGKGARVVLRVGEELLDSSLREFFKKKYKWNYSVYNDAKSAALATRNKDYQTAIKKATDSILYSIPKISASTKKIIKNTKNVAIDEGFSVSQNS
ncbi:MAG: hypothetical protein IJ215_01755 [Clostridia bacterium]|nr:hypothetical protein [Clostridia bacterium]